jgi:hypothetical protein
MTRRVDPRSASGQLPELSQLVDRGMLVPARRRLSEVLAAHPPVKLKGAQATSRALDEQPRLILDLRQP